MKLIRNAFAVGAIAAASLAACSSQHSSTGAGNGNGNGGPMVGALPGNGGDTGNIKMNLQVAGGNLYSLSYTCTGPSTIPPGTVNFNDAQSIEFVLGGIVAGSGYQCTLTGTDTSGDPCTGTSSSFDISPGAVSGATVLVTCTVPADGSTLADVNTGSVGFDASVVYNNQGAYACPGINSFSISPSEVIGSQPAQLGLSETGPTGLASDGGPSSSNVIWTATCSNPPCGSFTPSATAASPSFVCGPFAGDQIVTITAQVTDYQTSISTGVTSDVCAGKKFTTMTATIDCEGGGSINCAAIDPTKPNKCVTDAGTTCVNFASDPANCGSCANNCVANDPTKPNCSAGTCVAVPPGGPCVKLVGGVAADASGNTNCIKCDQNASPFLCTQTEAVIVQRDIDKSLVTGNAPSAASCYECLVSNFVIDGSGQGSGSECDDLSTGVQACLTTLNCIMGSPQAGTAGGTGTKGTLVTACANAPSNAPSGQPVDGVFNCFCGTAEPNATACKAAPTISSGSAGIPNGTCRDISLAGTSDTSMTSNSTIVNDLSGISTPSGKAYKILTGAGTNGTPSSAACAQCYQ